MAQRACPGCQHYTFLSTSATFSLMMLHAQGLGGLAVDGINLTDLAQHQLRCQWMRHTSRLSRNWSVLIGTVAGRFCRTGTIRDLDFLYTVDLPKARRLCACKAALTYLPANDIVNVGAAATARDGNKSYCPLRRPHRQADREVGKK